jgi:hypothetical protein
MKACQSTIDRRLLSLHRKIVPLKEDSKLKESVLQVIFIKGIAKQSLRLQLETLACNKEVNIGKLKDFAVKYEKEYESRVVTSNLQTENNTDINMRLNKIEETLQQLVNGVNKNETEQKTNIIKQKKVLHCFHCKRPGHISTECWFRQNNNFAQRGGPKRGNFGNYPGNAEEL